VYHPAAMRAVAFFLAIAVVSSCRPGAAAMRGDRTSASEPGRANKEVVTFPSGALMLHGVLYKPDAPVDAHAVFPTILWNHGSYGDPMAAFDELGPTFAARGWIFFGPFRRGQGLSASAGPYITDEIERAGKQGGMRAKVEAMVRLLQSDHLDDQLAAYRWIKEQAFVAPDRIAVAGNSFGGIETVLASERVPYCAAVDAAGGAQSWGKAPELRDLMVRAVRGGRVPTFFIQAENDYDLAPSNTLAAAMREGGKTTADLKIYPPFGSGQGEGHSFAWHGSAIWAADVFAFLERYCAR
jgi:carboxymethylenebutenolidase